MTTSWAVPALLALTTQAGSAEVPPLRVSDNHRFLVHADGRPFFWLADTAWEIFHRLTREEVDRYLEDRARKGYTVIQAVALAEFDGLNAPNAYGHLPLIDHDPTRPALVDGDANDYWDHVDYVVRKAASLGLYVGMLPTWGDKWNTAWAKGAEVFTPESARAYGEWIGRRYADQPIIWILGGDRPIENERHRAIITAMAEGLAAGDGGRHLRTFHPPGGRGSSEWFHEAPWLDFNLRQNGHGVEFARYAGTATDYARTPIKPVIDGEPVYEDHPIDFKAQEHGHSIAVDVRHAIYWDLFQGACGHTYGHHAVWQMASAQHAPVNMPLLPWTEAIDQPGARQVGYARWLIESRPFLTRIPDDSVIVTSDVPTSVPGAGRYRFVATRDSEGSYAMVYVPVGRAFSVRLDAVRAERVKAWWFDPRTGTATAAGEFAAHGEQRFISPTPGEELDWVLVLDDLAKGYPAPGTRLAP